MAEPPPDRNLVLILARNFASRLATAAFLVDADGRVIFFNEAAEELLGMRFQEGHGLAAEEYTERLAVLAEDGTPLGPNEAPIGIAVSKREPAHFPVTITGGDGVRRRIEATAFPLLAHVGDLVGAIAFFWEAPEAGA
jgi:PAS domain-containing protein